MSIFKKKSRNATEELDKRLRDNAKRLLNENTAFDVRESYREMRTNVMFSVTGEGSKVIAVTSSVASEGKSTTNFNLAITFAEMGARAIIIDCDMRRPNVGRLVGMHKKKGLSNYLINDAKLEDVIYKTEYDNLDVLLAGSIPPNPTELLASESMIKLIDKLKEEYDYVFLDTPPVTIVTDAAVISKFVDGIIIVSRQFISEKPLLKDAINKLKFVEAKIIGVVLNDVSANNGGYGGYKYKYYKRGYYKRGYYRAYQ